MSGTLFLVATPIGNRGDLSPRAREVLASVDLVCAEDTRVAGKLLAMLQVKKRLLRYDHHSHDRQLPHIVAALQEGLRVAYVSDAGTPGVEDPGGRLVAGIRAQCPEAKIVPIPGPSAVMTALSVSGFPAEYVHIFGFPPKKKGRQAYFDRMAGEEETVAFYESTHRIMDTLHALSERIPTRACIVARELTKLHETILRGTVSEVESALASGSQRGEFVVVLGPVRY